MARKFRTHLKTYIYCDLIVLTIKLNSNCQSVFISFIIKTEYSAGSADAWQVRKIQGVRKHFYGVILLYQFIRIYESRLKQLKYVHVCAFKTLTLIS